MNPLAQRTLRTVAADLAGRRLELLIRNINLRHELAETERDIAVVERRLAMIARTEAAA
jgi:IS1 family transposase